MKYRYISIPFYNSELLVVQLKKNTTWKEVKAVFKKYDFPNPKKISNIVVDKYSYDGGWTLKLYKQRQFAIIITRCSSENKRMNVILHEKRHIEDYILDMCGIHDIEAAGYLAGYLGDKILNDKKYQIWNE
jgi:hypothetical protein